MPNDNSENNSNALFGSEMIEFDPALLAAVPFKSSLQDDIKPSAAMLASLAEHSARLEIFEKRRKLRAIAVPTDDGRVRKRLRELNEPVTFFGEGPAERRDRLRTLMSERDVEAFKVAESDKSSDDDEEEEDYWTPGLPGLLEARLYLARYSLERAQSRIMEEKKLFGSTVNDLKAESFCTQLHGWTNLCSQLVDDRPTSFVACSPSSTILATGSFSGAIKLWDMPECKLASTLRGHTDRIGGIAWLPTSDPTTCNFVSGAADTQVCIWSLKQETPLATLKGHSARVCRVACHPSGRFAASAATDATWRLWDLEMCRALLCQDGHATGGIHAVAFQSDGALIASAGGPDKLARVWDLRTGRSVLTLRGHVCPIVTIDFSPTNVKLASGSQDNTIKIWDLRQIQAVYTVPAHTSLVSQLKYYSANQQNFSSENSSGVFLASCGFDGKINLWSASDYRLLRSLQGHEGKVMSIDISSNAQFIVSGGYDRTFKIWGPDSAPIED